MTSTLTGGVKTPLKYKRPTRVRRNTESRKRKSFFRLDGRKTASDFSIFSFERSSSATRGALPMNKDQKRTCTIIANTPLSAEKTIMKRIL